MGQLYGFPESKLLKNNWTTKVWKIISFYVDISILNLCPWLLASSTKRKGCGFQYIVCFLINMQLHRKCLVVLSDIVRQAGGSSCVAKFSVTKHHQKHFPRKLRFHNPHLVKDVFGLPKPAQGLFLLLLLTHWLCLDGKAILGFGNPKQTCKYRLGHFCCFPALGLDRIQVRSALPISWHSVSPFSSPVPLVYWSKQGDRSLICMPLSSI